MLLSVYLGTIAALCGVLYVTTEAEEGRIAARKVGGITFVRFGRYGVNFYVSRKGAE